MTARRGAVCFVGTGPAGARLGTERGADRIADADDVLRDGEAMAERIAGLVRSGRRVVRAVEGDPLESPAVVAEVRALAGAGIAVEVVPGIGWRAAAGAFAGALGRTEFVQAGAVAALVAGEPPNTPVTLVAGVGTSTQRVIPTTAGDAPARAQSLGAPSVLVVFGLPDDALRWFERAPLFGKRVLVTRSADQATSTAALLRDEGAEPVVVPTIAIHPPADPGLLERALSDLRAGVYGWVAFTSANGVERTWAALAAAGGDARTFGSARLAAIGPATAQALEKHGLRADVVAKEFRGEGLARAMLSAFGAGPHRVLLPRAAKARDALPQALRAAGSKVDVVAAYETRPPDRTLADRLLGELEDGRIDAVTFTSSSTVDNLCDLLGSRATELVGRARVASIGPVTTETARARGVRVDVTALEYTVPGLVEALAESFRLVEGRRRAGP